MWPKIIPIIFVISYETVTKHIYSTCIYISFIVSVIFYMTKAFCEVSLTVSIGKVDIIMHEIHTYQIFQTNTECNKLSQFSFTTSFQRKQHANSTGQDQRKCTCTNIWTVTLMWQKNWKLVPLEALWSNI